MRQHAKIRIMSVGFIHEHGWGRVLLWFMIPPPREHFENDQGIKKEKIFLKISMVFYKFQRGPQKFCAHVFRKVGSRQDQQIF